MHPVHFHPATVILCSRTAAEKTYLCTYPLAYDGTEVIAEGCEFLAIGAVLESAPRLGLVTCLRTFCLYNHTEIDVGS